MINNISQNPSNVSFKASIVSNRRVILDTLSKDKKLTGEDFKIISKLLDKIDSFSKMKEDSIVEVSAKVDRWQTKIICNVYDKTKKMFAPVEQRTVKSLKSDEKYREKHINSLQTLIKNIAITRKSVDKITKTASDFKSAHFEGKNVQECFENRKIVSHFLKALNEGYNPTKKIVKFLKHIDKKTKPDTKINLAIIHKRDPGKKLYTTFFSVSLKNGDEITEKKVLLSELFRKPLEDKLI